MLRARLLLPLLAVIAIAVTAYVQALPPAVRVAVVETGLVMQVVYATGTVRPETETRVAPEVRGRLESILVEEGDTVRAGQPLAYLDTREARIRLQEAETRLSTARARLRQAAAPGDPLSVQQAQARETARQAQVAGTEARLVTASERVAAAEAGLEAARAAVIAARARARALEEAARGSAGDVETARELAAGAAAEAAQARATQETARDLLSRRTLLFREGAISERLVTEARTAAASADAMVQAAQRRQAAQESAAVVALARAASTAAQAEDAAAAVQAAEAQARAAQAQLAEARAALAELPRAVDAQAAELAAARAQLRQTRRGLREVEIAPLREEVRAQLAAVAWYRNELNRYTLRAPVSGRLTLRAADPGDFAAAGAPLFTIAAEQQIHVRADVDEADIGALRPGSRAHFQVDALPGRTFSGRVTRIGRAADRATRTYPVEIRDLHSITGLRLGMTADVNIEGRATHGAVLIPTAALQSEGDRTTVWVVDSEDRARRRTVRIQSRDAGSVHALEGVAAGERLILNPGRGLREGRRVHVVPAGAS